MATLYLQLTTGISGDMFMASLLDLGLSLEKLKSYLSTVHLEDYELQVEEVRKRGLRGLQFRVHLLKEEREERNLSLITHLIEDSQLPQEVKETSIEVFTNLAQAEAWAHGTSIHKVHFHEVGAIDSIIDIVGVSLGLYLLEIETIYASSIPLGQGFTMSRHGKIPLPATATTYLLQGVPCYGTGIERELVTPTGAALIRTLVKGFGPLKEMKVVKIGVGCGARDLEVPNILRVFLGEEKREGEENTRIKEKVLTITTQLDDLSPEILPYVQERLFLAGALDVYRTPIIMKKGRLGTELKVLLPIEKREELISILFEETSTLGVRIHEEERVCLHRTKELVSLFGHEVGIKLGLYRGRVMNIAPEYRDCYRVAREVGRPLKEVYQRAIVAYEQKCKEDGNG